MTFSNLIQFSMLSTIIFDLINIGLGGCVHKKIRITTYFLICINSGKSNIRITHAQLQCKIKKIRVRCYYCNSEKSILIRMGILIFKVYLLIYVDAICVMKV